MVIATNRLRIKEIERLKLYKELDDAVKSENQEILKERCNVMLHRLTTRIDYDIVMEDVEIKELLKENNVLPKKKKRLTKLIKRIRAGAIKIKHPIKSDYFLNDKELANLNPAEYNYSEVALVIRRNISKIITFLACSIIIATISFSFTTVDFWTTFVTNFTLLLGAMTSGFTRAYKDVQLKTAIYEKRNRFLIRRLEIGVEYEEK